MPHIVWQKEKEKEVTHDKRHKTRDMWHMTQNMWHIEGGENSLKILGEKCFEDIFTKDNWVTQSLRDEGVWRTTSLTLGLFMLLLKIYQ